MANTFELIQAVTLTGSQASLDFTSIPSTYSDLLIKCSLRTSEAAIYTDIDITFNGESARQWRGLYAVTTSLGTSTSTSFNIVAPATAANSTASNFSNCDIYIQNYTSSDVKSIGSEGVSENNSGSNFALNMSGNTVTNGTAVTTINLVPFGGNSFVQHSTGYLYGIKNS